LPENQANITPPKLDPDGGFRVREFTALSIVAAAVFYIIFFLALANILGQQTTLPNHRYKGITILPLCLLPAITFTVKAIMRRVYILVNNTGIYLYGQFITGWPTFVDALYKFP
jgi:hypothetical protein